MNKIVFTPGESYVGNLRDYGSVSVVRAEDSKLWKVLSGDQFVAEASDRAELEQRYGRFTEVQVN